MQTNLDLSPADRTRSLIAIIATICVAGAGFGLATPLLSLMLSRDGHAGATIGIFAALPALSTLLFAAFVPAIMRRIGTVGALGLFFAAMIATLMLFMLSDSLWVWFVLRFVLGLAFTGLFVATEIWINLIADDKTRGQTLGIYAAALSGGFAVGAGLLALVGEQGWLGVILAGGVLALAIIPLIVARDLAPEAPPADGMPAVLPYLTAAPAAMMAAFVFGAVEMGILNLLPVYGERAGLLPAAAAIMLMAAAAGNVVCQIPLGMLADRIDRQAVLLGCAIVGTLAAVVIPLTLNMPWLLYPTLFIFGGIIVGLYTIGLTRMGERFQGGQIAGANAAFITMYGAGALVGPPLSGVAMDLWDPTGLMMVLGAFCGTYALLVYARHRRSRSLTGTSP